MINKRIIGFSLILIFLLIGLNTVSASSLVENSRNMSDSLESSPISNAVDIVNDDSQSLDSAVSSSNGNSPQDLVSTDSDDEMISEDSNNEIISKDDSLGMVSEESTIEEISNIDDANEDEKDSAQSKSKLGDGEKTVHTITEDDYSNYFDSDGNLINSLVKANDTINLSGNFSNKKFIINIPLTITSTEKNAVLNNSPIYYLNVSNENFAYDAIVSDLKIESNLPDISAVWVIASTNIKILNNDIFTTGHNGYPISLDSFTYNCIVQNNTIKTVVPVNTAIDSSEVNYDEENSGDNSSWQHSGISLRDAHWNSIVGNDITVENSYGVYLCYGSSISNNNIIANNTIRATAETPSFWSYGVYLTGNYNRVENNTIIRMYRGIHSSYPHNIIIGNQIYNVTGFDENNGLGGDYGIYGGNDTLIANNSIYNADVIGAGILVGSNSDVYGNYIQINSSGDGIRIGDVEGGHNSKVHNNTIDFLSGAGICVKGTPQNTEVYENIINSLSEIGAIQGSGLGLGILAIYQSRNNRPYNISIFNNTIYTSNDYAINIAQLSVELWYCDNNTIGDRKIIYPISIDYSPNWGDGTVYQVTEENYNSYFNSDGTINSMVKDGDVLVFNGNFSPKGKIVLNKIVSIIGDNAILKDTTIFVNTSNCRIQDLNIINNGTSDDNCNLWGIYVFEADYEVICGNNITVWDKNTSYGIYLCDSYNDTVVNNSLKCQGDNLVFGILTYETYNTLFENNSILAIGTSELYPYYETICIDGVRSISELSKTYGVILDFSSDNQFIHNDIEVTSTVEGFQVPYNPSVNILIGLYIYYASNGNNISENNVYIHGHDPFLYGVGSSGDDTSKSVTYACNNVFSKNNITIEADYFAMGMILRHNSKDTIVEENYFKLHSNNYTYGITLEISEGAKIRNNTLNSTSRAGIYAMELYSSNYNDISNNQIYAEGSFATVALFASSHNNVTNNTIRTYGDEKNDPAQGPEHPDSVKLIHVPISLQTWSTDNNIADNDIETDAKDTIDIDETSAYNTIKNNRLSSRRGEGTVTINDRSGKNFISGNYGSKSGLDDDSSNPSGNGNSSGNANSGNANSGKSKSSSSSNSNSKSRGSPIYSSGSSSNSGFDDSNGASAFGDMNTNFDANAQSSANDGAGDAGDGGDIGDGDGSDVIVSEIEEVASKSISKGLSIPVAAFLLVLLFCFSFIGAKNEDDE